MNNETNITQQNPEENTTEHGFTTPEFLKAVLSMVTIQEAAKMFNRKSTATFKVLLNKRILKATRVGNQDYYHIAALEAAKDAIGHNRLDNPKPKREPRTVSGRTIHRQNLRTVYNRLESLEARLRVLEDEWGIKQ